MTVSKTCFRPWYDENGELVDRRFDKKLEFANS